MRTASHSAVTEAAVDAIAAPAQKEALSAATGSPVSPSPGPSCRDSATWLRCGMGHRPATMPLNVALLPSDLSSVTVADYISRAESQSRQNLPQKETQAAPELKVCAGVRMSVSVCVVFLLLLPCGDLISPQRD